MVRLSRDEHARSVFDAIDADHDGSIDTAEFAECLRRLKLGIASRPDRVSQLFELLDENGDGSVTFDEFRPVYAS